MSSTKSSKKSGPNAKPCGTFDITLALVVCDSHDDTNYFRPVK